MLDIQMKELAKARRILDVLGCKYAIVLPDGAMLGELPILKQSKEKIKPRKDYSALRIPERVSAMKVGDVLEIEAVADLTLGEIQGNISSYGTTTFGAGNFTTSRNKRNNTVECMRTG